MQTTYYVTNGNIGDKYFSVWRATTKICKEKIDRKIKEGWDSLKPILPKDAKMLIKKGVTYIKAQDI